MPRRGSPTLFRHARRRRHGVRAWSRRPRSPSASAWWGGANLPRTPAPSRSPPVPPEHQPAPAHPAHLRTPGHCVGGRTYGFALVQPGALAHPGRVRGELRERRPAAGWSRATAAPRQRRRGECRWSACMRRRPDAHARSGAGCAGHGPRVRRLAGLAALPGCLDAAAAPRWPATRAWQVRVSLNAASAGPGRCPVATASCAIPSPSSRRSDHRDLGDMSPTTPRSISR